MKPEEVNLITKGNEEATTFIVSYVAFCHLLDDVMDDKESVTDKRLVTETLRFLEQVISNPWVRANIGFLWPLIVTGANSWIDSNSWAESTLKEKRQASDVLKGQYHEVVWFTAYLCGGIEHQQEITSKFRDYDFDNQ